MDYKDLCALLGKFKEKANEVNESINQAENQRKCLKIQKLFGTTTGDLQVSFHFRITSHLLLFISSFI